MLSRSDIAFNFNRLLNLTRGVLGSDWAKMLEDLKDPRVFDGQIYLGFADAPAAKGNHHAHLGGLVEHLLQMWEYYEILQDQLPYDPLITQDRVLKGILVHDLHKAWATFIEVPVNDKAQAGLDYGKHPSNSMLSNDQKTVYLLMQHGLVLDMVDMNVLFNSEGGWAEHAPRWVTTLAKLVYLLDEMSGNVAQRSIQGNNIDLRTKHLDPNKFEVHRFSVDS